MKQITIKRVIPLDIRTRGDKADWLATSFVDVIAECEDMNQLDIAIDGFYPEAKFSYIRDTEPGERPIYSFCLVIGKTWSTGQVEETVETVKLPIGNEAAQLWRIMRDRRNDQDKTDELMTEADFEYWYGDPDCVPANGPTRREYNLPHSK